MGPFDPGPRSSAVVHFAAVTRALVVDDDADIRALVRAVLEPLAFEVVEAADGNVALSELRSTALPDVVVLDVEMPDVDGWETLAAIRSEPRTSTLPVVLCTARALRSDLERAWALGSDGYLSKPFTVGQLADEITAVCELSAAERAEVRGDQRRRLAGA